jgi:hypothetical protein
MGRSAITMMPGQQDTSKKFVNTAVLCWPDIWYSFTVTPSTPSVTLCSHHVPLSLCGVNNRNICRRPIRTLSRCVAPTVGTTSQMQHVPCVSRCVSLRSP